MRTIGGNVTVKNAIRFDYCVRQCVGSLLSVCDVVNVVDSDSDDGTVELLRGMASENPKIRVLNYVETDRPGGDPDFILDKMNWSRERLGTDYHLHLEADEVLGPESQDYILQAAEAPGVVLGMRRYNFWCDGKHLLAPGYILSSLVIRFSPTVFWLGGDAPHPKATETEPAARWAATEHCHIYHYGFLRRQQSYLSKWTSVMRSWAGSENADPNFLALIRRCIADGKSWMPEMGLPMEEFVGKHPESMLEWLKERGYSA